MKVKLKRGDKLKIMLFFEKDSRPEVHVAEYRNDFHYNHLIKGFMIMANENMEVPEVLICYKKGKNPSEDSYLTTAVIDDDKGKKMKFPNSPKKGREA